MQITKEGSNNMTDEFKKIVDDDIKRGKEIIEKRDVQNCDGFHDLLISKYSPLIESFDENLYSLLYEKNEGLYNAYFANIKMMIEQLELSRAMGFKNMKSLIAEGTGITINNNNTNSNTVDINVSFEQARGTIENMTALPDPEVEEILSKIDELEKIIQSSDRKTKKWENAKGIVKWIADKGVDVGMTLIPLLLQIQ
jgi:hypothetical protein